MSSWLANDIDITSEESIQVIAYIMSICEQCIDKKLINKEMVLKKLAEPITGPAEFPAHLYESLSKFFEALKNHGALSSDLEYNQVFTGYVPKTETLH